MLELNGLQCWVTGADLNDLPETIVLTDSPELAACTVYLQTKYRSFIIHWRSTTPIKAWCMINFKKSPSGRIHRGIMECEMNEARLETQIRSTREFRDSGRNLSFGGCRVSPSGYLGTAWLEIIRRVDDVSADLPDTEVFETTFKIDFKLDDRATLSSPANGILSNVRSSGRRDNAQKIVIPNLNESINGQSMPSIAVEGEISEQDPDVVEAPNSSGAQKRGREDSQSENNTHELKRSRMEEAVIPTTPVHNPKTPEMAKMPIQRTHTETTLPETSAIETPTQTQLPEVPTPQSSIQTQPDAPTPQTPNQPQSDVVDSTTPVPNTEIPQLALELSDDEGDDFESKIAILETEIETYTKELVKATEKEKFMVIKRQSVQSITDIKSLEAVCGPIPSKIPTHENWDLINNEIPDDESGYGEKVIYMEETLPSLERYRTALEYKKIYIEKKTMLKRVKMDVRSAEQRCREIFANITEIVSMQT